MKVGIDTLLARKSKAGIGSVIENLLAEFSRKQLNVLEIAPDKEVHLNTPKRLLWDQLQAPRRAKKMGVDIFHQPGLSAPFFPRVPTVVSFYHYVPKVLQKQKEFYLGRLGTPYFYHWVPHSLKYAEHVITSSEYSRKSILENLNIPPEKVTAIHLAPSEVFTKMSPMELKAASDRLKKQFPGLNEYLIFIGTTVPYKNFKLLIKIFKELKKMKPSLKLVICGGKTFFTSQIKLDFLNQGLKDQVIFTGHIPDSQLHDLLVKAKILLLPSLYEGFGMPPLEAMQCGVPVISSDATCLPETVGNGGILLSPEKPDLWVKAILDVLSSSRLQKDLICRGLAHVERFSWEKAAAQTYSVYEHVYRKRH